MATNAGHAFDSTGSPGSGTPPAPHRVAREAEQRRLGALQWVRHDPNPVVIFMICVAISVVLGGAVALATLLPAATLFLVVLVLFAGLAAIVVLLVGFFHLFTGRVVAYGYAGGLVWTERRRVE